MVIPQKVNAVHEAPTQIIPMIKIVGFIGWKNHPKKRNPNYKRSCNVYGNQRTNS